MKQTLVARKVFDGFTYFEINGTLLLWNLFCRCPACGRLIFYYVAVAASYLGSKRIFNTTVVKWYDWVRSGQDNFWLEFRTYRLSAPLSQVKFIIFSGREGEWLHTHLTRTVLPFLYLDPANLNSVISNFPWSCSSVIYYQLFRTPAILFLVPISSKKRGSTC